MKIRSLLLFLLLAGLALFTVINWGAISTPTNLSLLFTTVQAPLGIILLGVMVLMGCAFMILLVFQQATVLLETRRSAKELSAQRALADQAEASRFTELRNYLDSELQRFEALTTARQQTIASLLERGQQAVMDHVDQAATTLTAYFGEVEDRLDRLVAAAALPNPGKS